MDWCNFRDSAEAAYSSVTTSIFYRDLVIWLANGHFGSFHVLPREYLGPRDQYNGPSAAAAIDPVGFDAGDRESSAGARPNGFAPRIRARSLLG